MNKIKEQLSATDLARWRKQGIFVFVVLSSVFSFYMTYRAAEPDLAGTLWRLRHFVGIAAMQAIAALSLAWYILKNRVPNYVIGSFVMMALFFQITYGIAVIFASNA